ncbi:MAG: response regulator [Acidobacteriota bacterium]
MVTATKRFLVVDDERSVCASVEKILARRGHEVEKALSVASAVALIESGPSFDLIIADLMMPQSSGLEVLSESDLTQ